MRAVNLIPGDQRGGASVGAGRSEGAAYAVLALLVAIAALAVLYGKANREVSSRKAQAVTINAEAQRAQAEASQLAPYTSFVALRTEREQAVATLVDSRFDWAHAFHEFGRVLTGQTQIITLDGSIAANTDTTVTSGVGAPAATTSVSSATPPGSVPTFNLTGCATSQDAVAQMLGRLRLIDGVNTVTLLSSTKSGGGTGSAGGCPPKGPAFAVTVAFDALPSAAASAAAVKPAAAPVSNSSASSTAGSTSNASSGGAQ